MNLDRLQIWLDKDTRPGDDNIRWQGTSEEECKEMQTPLNKQIGGTHYQECKIQPGEFIEANKLLFFEGCVIKRLCRHDKPTGKGREDIEKAIHELQLILELRYGD